MHQPKSEPSAADTARGFGDSTTTDVLNRSVTHLQVQPKSLSAKKACASCGKPFSSARRPAGIAVYQTVTATDAFRSSYVVCRRCKLEAKRCGGLNLLLQDHELALKVARIEPLGDVQ